MLTVLTKMLRFIMSFSWFVIFVFILLMVGWMLTGCSLLGENTQAEQLVVHNTSSWGSQWWALTSGIAVGCFAMGWLFLNKPRIFRRK